MNEQNTSQQRNADLSQGNTNTNNSYGVEPQEWNKLDADGRESFSRIHAGLSKGDKDKFVQEMTGACGSGDPQTVSNTLNRIINAVALVAVNQLQHA